MRGSADISSYCFGTIVESFVTGPGAPPHAVGHDALGLKY
jgi:hypothetical protein